MSELLDKKVLSLICLEQNMNGKVCMNKICDNLWTATCKMGIKKWISKKQRKERKIRKKNVLNAEIELDPPFTSRKVVAL